MYLPKVNGALHMEKLLLDGTQSIYFFVWIWVAGAPRTTSRRFSPVAGAYGDLCAMTKQQQEQYENAVPKYTSRPTANFITLFYLTSRQIQRENQQKCASSLPWTGQTNNSHAIFYQQETDSHASKVSKLTAKTINGIRRLLKDNRPVEACELWQALRQFLTFLRASIDSPSKRSSRSWLDTTLPQLIFQYFFEMVAKILSRSLVPSVPSGLQTLWHWWSHSSKASTLPSKMPKVNFQSLARVLFTNIYFKPPLMPTTP